MPNPASAYCEGQGYRVEIRTAEHLQAIQVVVIVSVHGREVLDSRGNPTVEAAQARIAQAEERIAQTRSAYYPRLDASAGAFNNRASNFKEYLQMKVWLHLRLVNQMNVGVI